ncbi:hypothetical protein ACLB2K_000357 [Fragaria x ananassa]
MSLNPESSSGLKLKDEYADKSLFICSFESYEKSIPTARQVANLVDDDLPYEGGCGVLGSKIVFASGLKPNPNPEGLGPFGPDPSTHAYALMPGELNGGKQKPLMAEFGGKLYEDIIEIMEMKLPAAALPEQPGDCHLFHLGGNNVCLVTTGMREPEKKYEADHRGMIFTVQGAAIAFQFEFDISKVDKDRKNCLTVQFQPPRIFEYHLRPDSTFPPHTLGCFVL